MTFAPPNPADRVGQFAAPFEDRMLLAFEALVMNYERMGSWSQHTVVDAVDLYSINIEDFSAMFDVLIHAAEATFDV